MNQPYCRVKIRVFGTTEFEIVEKKRDYQKYSGSKKAVRNMLKKVKPDQLAEKE